MALTKITFTGIDDTVHPNDLLRLSEKYPFVEWGILLSRRLAGYSRYASMHTITSLAKFACVFKIDFAGHVCGEWARDMLVGGHMFERDLGQAHLNMFKRFQWNVNTSHADYKLDAVVDVLQQHAKQKHIFQMNRQNEIFVSLLLDRPVPLNILFDASGGRGVVAKTWPEGIAGQYCGWAGGLGPSNIAVELPKIAGAACGQDFWIDMESGVRTNDKFDMHKVEICLEVAQAFIESCNPKPTKE